jgi:hypothetical protein
MAHFYFLANTLQLRLHGHDSLSDPPPNPWIGAASSPDFDAQKHKSPSVNHGKHRVAAPPGHHHRRHKLVPVRNEILGKYKTFCERSQAEVLKGVQKLCKTHATHTEYID